MRLILKFLVLPLVIPAFGQAGHTVYLIGDAGEFKSRGPALEALKNDMAGNDNSTVIFLGDNIYPRGYYDEGSKKAELYNAKILSQLSVVDDGFQGNAFFVPGNHDWKKSRPNGLAFIKRQGEFVERYLKDNSQIKNKETGSFLPKEGNLGPEIRKIDYEGGSLKLIFFDTQWWLHKSFIHKVNKPKGISTIDYLDQQLEILSNEVDESANKSEMVIVMAHHPLFTMGSHGLARPGYKFARILDLPFFGLLGSFRLVSQNLSGRRYGILQKKLIKILDNKNVIYAAGHEHNLQYWRKGNMHQIVSGSGSKTTDYYRKTIGLKWNKSASLEFPKLESEKQTSNLGYFKLIFSDGEDFEIRVIEVSDKGDTSCEVLFPLPAKCNIN